MRRGKTRTLGASPAGFMTEADQHAELHSKSGAKSIAIMVACVAVIVAGMAWYLTYDWPSGRRPDIGCSGKAQMAQ